MCVFAPAHDGKAGPSALFVSFLPFGPCLCCLWKKQAHAGHPAVFTTSLMPCSGVNMWGGAETDEEKLPLWLTFFLFVSVQSVNVSCKCWHQQHCEDWRCSWSCDTKHKATTNNHLQLCQKAVKNIPHVFLKFKVTSSNGFPHLNNIIKPKDIKLKQRKPSNPHVSETGNIFDDKWLNQWISSHSFYVHRFIVLAIKCQTIVKNVHYSFPESKVSLSDSLFYPNNSHMH